MRYQDYFNQIASTRLKNRASHSYYWNSITRTCDYFSHESNSVLEIGSGTGDLIHALKGKRKVGLDFSESMVDISRSRFPEIEFHCMAAERLDLHEKFDLVILSNLIGFVGDVQAVFEQLHKVCHPRTKIIITYYNFLWEPAVKFAEWIHLKRKTPNQNWLLQQDIKNLLTLAGFDVYRNTRGMMFPFYIPLLSPFLNRFLVKLPLFRLLALNTFTFARPRPLAAGSPVPEYSVSIVIPARNEAGNIENAVQRIPKFGSRQEIIFVEGHSADDTWQVIKDVQKKYFNSHDIKITRQPGKGKNDAVRAGFGMATGDILMILDADLTMPPEELPKFYQAIASGQGDFIQGSRLVYDMDKGAMRLLNLLGNKFFSFVFSWMLEQPVKDTLCGTKVLLRSDYEKLVANRKFFGDFDPFGDFDLIFGAYKLNLRMIEIPIRYRERTYGNTNISRFKNGLVLLKMCFFAARKIKFVG